MQIDSQMSHKSVNVIVDNFLVDYYRQNSKEESIVLESCKRKNVDSNIFTNSCLLNLYSQVDLQLQVGNIEAISTGIKIQLPNGFAGLVVPTKNFSKQGIKLVNSPGLIDSGYRGEIKVICVSLSNDVVSIKKGDVIAKLLVIEHA